MCSPGPVWVPLGFVAPKTISARSPSAVSAPGVLPKRFLELGAADVIAKPFQLMQLPEQITTIWNSPVRAL
jgi:hypothetical protein